MNNNTMISRTLDLVLQNALKYPDKIAVQGISYARLAKKICGLSRQIEGDKVLIACEQGLDAYVAMLAALHPLGVIASGIFLASIYVGADSMSRSMNVPTYLADVIVAITVLCVLMSLIMNQYKFRFLEQIK